MRRGERERKTEILSHLLYYILHILYIIYTCYRRSVKLKCYIIKILVFSSKYQKYGSQFESSLIE